jgi:hypothetical protein
MKAVNLGIDFANAKGNRFQDRAQTMKSAYELAMERLEKASPTLALTEEQKKQIAEIDSSFKAKIAEREVFLKDQIGRAQATQKFEEVDELEKQLATEVRRLQEDCEAKKEKLRATFSNISADA